MMVLVVHAKLAHRYETGFGCRGNLPFLSTGLHVAALKNGFARGVKEKSID